MLIAQSDDDETEELALGMSDQPAQTPRAAKEQQQQQHPDSPTPGQQHVISSTEQVPNLPAKDEATDTPKPESIALAKGLGEQGTGAGIRRRSTGNGNGSGRKNKVLGDTDSESEHEPGYATVLKS